MNKKIIFILNFLVISGAVFASTRDYFDSKKIQNYYDTQQPQTAEYYNDLLKGKSILDLSFDEWFYGPNAFADAYYWRSKADEHGIIPKLSYIGNFAGNPSGGMTRGVSNTSSLGLDLGIQLDKLFNEAALSSWSIGNSWSYRWGESLTERRIGNVFNVQQDYGSQTLMLNSIFAQYKSKIFDEYTLLFKIGRFAAGENFITKPIYWMYMNNAFDGTPVGIFKQLEWSSYPSGTWAMFMQIVNEDGIYAKTGVYEILSKEQNSNKNHGMEFGFTNGLGVNVNFEIGWDINHDDSGESPGNISAGLAADWYNAKHNDNPNDYSYFNYTIYAQADYMILNLGSDNHPETPYYIQRAKNQKYRDIKGIVLWGVMQFNPNENLAYMPLFLNGGLLFNGLVPHRKDDVVVLGAAYGKFSEKLTTSERGSYEIALEANYKLQINRFMFLQPNLQYILNVKGGQYPDAIVLGMQYGINF